MKEADVIIALGTRLGFNSTFFSYENLNKKAKIIQIELEHKMLGRYFPSFCWNLCRRINSSKTIM